MQQKKVKIIGLAVNHQVGILQACKIDFDDKNRLNIVKGGVGEGKSTLTKNLQLGTQGTKTLVDKQLYGDIDTEVQLLDGEKNIWVGCKSDKNGKLVYSLYTKDDNGKKVKEPIIDSVKATPSKYLEALQTELTWRLDELTSENPTVQKKILLSMYQHAFSELGVIFDKKSPLYKDSILDKIEKAEDNRNTKDATRKQVGGIKEDLKANGFDPDRPATIPDAVDINVIDEKIKEQEKQKTIEETQSTSGKDLKLQEIKTEVSELTNKAVNYNAELKTAYEKKIAANQLIRDEKVIVEECLQEINVNMNKLIDYKVLNKNFDYATFLKNVTFKKDPAIVQEPKYILFSEDGKMITTGDFEKEATKIFTELEKSRVNYTKIVMGENPTIDLSKFNDEITKLEDEKKKGIEINKIVAAVDSWHEWSDADGKVKELKKEYVKMLAKVETGVEGLKIVPEETEGKLDIFLMYDGSFDPKYFSNKDKKMIKLSAYSGTQKPVICLLIQNYLLSKKPKAMRYMFIDNVPVDKKTIMLLDEMGEKLDLTIFLNITGDFDKNTIKDGEILIEGGEVFFAGLEKTEQNETKEIKKIDDLPF